MSSLEEKDMEKSSAEHSPVESEEKDRMPFDTVPNPTTRTDQGVEEAEEPTPTSGQQQPRNLARIHTTRSQRSYAGADGYTRFSVDEENQAGQDIPQREKKEFEVSWDGDNDPMNPRSKALARKWLIVLIVSGSSLCVTCTSALYTSTYAQLERDFGCSREVATLGLSLFVMGLGIGPMVLSPLSEFYGRRPIYIASYTFFLIWLIPCAVAQNTQTMLVARFLDGLSGSAFLSVAGGTVGDLFVRSQLSLPMIVYTASPFIGPEIGPIMGGFINQYADWRWTFYVLLIWSGVQLVLIIFFVPETYHPVLLRNKAVKLRKETGNDAWHAPIEIMNKSVVKTVAWSCVRPFQLLFFEQMCLNLCLLSAILLGILYLFFGAFPLVFENNHGFTQSQSGLTFLGIFIGMIIGVSCDPLWKKYYTRLVNSNNGESEPEYRLPPAIMQVSTKAASRLCANAGQWSDLGASWTIWFRMDHLPILPIIFSGIFGLGNIFVFGGVFTFLVECYPLYAASALAANSFARSSFAAAFPLFGVQMYNKLGYQWASTLLAFLALAMTPFPYLVFKYGKRLRGSSRFAQKSS